jgi:micrococcal nuclease
MWQYKAQLIKAVDGDTVDLMVDLGFKIYSKIRVRLSGVDTPERGEPGYHGATQYVEDWFGTQGDRCILETTKTGKYGRWLGTIWPVRSPPDEEGERDYRTLNKCLLDDNQGVPYE